MKKVKILLYGLLIFPVVIIVSLILGVFGLNYLIWMVIPSVLFEEIFERAFYSFSNNIYFNVTKPSVYNPCLKAGACIGLVTLEKSLPTPA